MTTFSIFVIFYATTIMLELVEKWEHPAFAGAVFILTTALVFTKITRPKFLFFLILTTAYFLGLRFPEVPTHVNLIILCNILLTAGVVYSLFNRHRFPDDEDYFDMMLPFLRVALIPIYFVAGFHKLNSDFFDPEVSCATGILHNLKVMLQSNLWGVPTPLVIAVGLGLILWKLYNPELFALIRSHFLKIALLFGCGLILLIILASLIANNNITKTDFKDLIILATMAIVLIWELGGLLLAVPKFQAPVLLVAWIMHSILALNDIVDFSSFAFTFLLTFIPKNYYEIMNANAAVSVLNYQIHRAHAYFILNAIGGVFTGVYFLFYPEFNVKVITGILLNAGAIIFIFPILRVLFSPGRRPRWLGVPVFNKTTSKLVYVFLVLLVLHGMTSYLGLRTSGNYSMYSNLRTEGETSNHLLFKNNPLKMSNYQEDVVYFIEIDDELSKIGHKYRPLKESKLPVVEFRKLIYQWKNDGRRIPLKFEHGGEIYETGDVVADPRWSVEKRDWEMTLMDFRIIQPEGPNRCRW